MPTSTRGENMWHKGMDRPVLEHEHEKEATVAC